MDRRRALPWIATIAAYPLLVAACVLATFVVWAVAEPFGLLQSTTSELAVGCVLTGLVFAAAALFARRKGAPAKAWLIPWAGLVIYAVSAAFTFRGDPPTESFPPSLAILSMSAVLLCAALGAAVGTAIHSRSQRRRALTEQALQPGAPKVGIES